MEPRSTTPNRSDLIVRIGAVVVFGPLLVILILPFLSPGTSAFPPLGWIFLLAGSAFLAFTTLHNFAYSIGIRSKKIISTEAEMGIIGLGLALISPSVLLAGYFYFLVILSAVLIFTGLFMLKDKPDPKARLDE
jgi:hypothetical protein